MTDPSVQGTTVGDCSDCYVIWTTDFEPARYCSVYLLDGDNPVIVDTGTGQNVDVILDGLAELGIQPSAVAAILLTHVHLDHAGGAGKLLTHLPDADVYVHEGGAPHLIDPERLWEGTKRAVGKQISRYAEPRPIPPDRIVELTDGDLIHFGDHAVAVHEAPGHAFHQVVFQELSTGGVFTGDAAGVKTPGIEQVRESSPPPGFDLEGCLADVEMIRDLDPTALYLGHFGDHRPEELIETYPSVLEAWVESVAKRRSSMPDEAVVEAFAAETETVEAWGPLKAEAETRMNVRGVMRYLDA